MGLSVVSLACVTAVTSFGEPGVPGPAIREMLGVDWLETAERSALHRTHGLWDEQDLHSADDRLEAALVIGDYRSEVWKSPQASDLLVATLLAQRGEVAEAMAHLQGIQGSQADLLRGDLFLLLGQADEARTSWEMVVADDMAAGRVAAVTALQHLAELDRAGGDAYQDLMNAYGAVKQLDLFDVESRLAEARLLLEKHNPALAAAAVLEVLSINPRLGEAWLIWGRLNLNRFDFDTVDGVIASLRDIVPDHPMADLLEGESLLKQHDPHGALERARRIRLALPWWREAMALELAAMAVLEDAYLNSAMTVYESRFPGCPQAAFQTGRALSFHRQYPEADRWLKRAIEIRPQWPLPWIDLGLMQWQNARGVDAANTLREAVQLDHFNRRAVNSLAILEEVAGYDVVETPHFIVRYQPGVDGVLVREMVPRLASIHDDTVAAFGWTPRRKTVIELYPDHKRFAIRIVGMPDIHTVAACTGPCVAMEAPRRGVPSEHFGPYDWERVLRHEFTHTVNLDQTDYRVPLWFTEAAAVWMEPGPRNWKTSRMLAEELAAGTLLSMDELSWAFVRPRRPQDRSLAYAQSNWMLEFIVERWGREAMLRLMQGFGEGLPRSEVFQQAIGLSETELFEAFLIWSNDQVRSWGLAAEPSLAVLLQGDEAAAQQQSDDLMHQLRILRGRVGASAAQTRSGDLTNRPAEATIEDDETLMRLLATHPNHPDVLEAAVLRWLEGGQFDEQDPLELIERYVEIRPGDPTGHEAIARWWMDRDEPERAIASLEALAAQEAYDPMRARRLSRALRVAGDAAGGLAAMTRSVGISPYDPSLREEAAAAALDHGDDVAALRHLEALLVLEPDQPLHLRRLEALRKMLERE